MSAIQQLSERFLTALDRCDRCGAQAYVAVEVSGTELLFCAHDWKLHQEKLEQVASLVVDNTEKLLN